jgi:hypothetical protein
VNRLELLLGLQPLIKAPSIRQMRSRSTISAAPIWSGTITSMRSLTIQKRSGSIRNMPSLSEIAAMPGAKREISTARLRTTVIKFNPRNALAFSSRRLVRLRRGELGGSIEDFDAALALEPRLADSLYGRGIAKRKNGDPAGADADLAAAKMIRPSIEQEFASEIE